MQMTELAKQLRHIAADPMWAKGDVYSHVIAEAADRIEQLEAALRDVANEFRGCNGILISSDYAAERVKCHLDQSSPPKATDCTCPVGMHSIGCHNR
jgi:hypothetical protein